MGGLPEEGNVAVHVDPGAVEAVEEGEGWASPVGEVLPRARSWGRGVGEEEVHPVALSKPPGEGKGEGLQDQAEELPFGKLALPLPVPGHAPDAVDPKPPVDEKPPVEEDHPPRPPPPWPLAHPLLPVVAEDVEHGHRHLAGQVLQIVPGEVPRGQHQVQGGEVLGEAGGVEVGVDLVGNEEEAHGFSLV